jgi:transposase
MKLTISKSKNAEQLYICKSVRVNKNKTTSQIVRKLGTMASLLPFHDNDRDKVIAWAREQAAIMTKEEKSSAMKVAIEVSESILHKKGEQFRFNAGYLFLQDIYSRLGLSDICRQISGYTKTEYDLSDILAKLIYTRIIAPASKLSSFGYAKNFVQQPGFDLHQIYRALDVLAEHSDMIQAALYRNSLDVMERDKGILYYDCTNYFFELEEAKGSRQYGKSKDHKPNPMIQMGLFMDGSGLPLAFSMFPGNENEQPSLKPLEKKILQDFGLSRFVVCTDAGLASGSNRRFNDISGRSYIVTQSLKTMKKHLQDWALDPSGWKTTGSDNLYDLGDIDEEINRQTIYFKERWISENGLSQRLIVTYCVKYRDYLRGIRSTQIERAEKIVKKGGRRKTSNPSSPERFIAETAATSDGEVAEKMALNIDEDRIKNEEMFDGFYGVCTTLEDDVSSIISVNKRRWQIEAAFRTMKTEFRARPVYLQKDNRIEAHFLTCFISLLIMRILEKELDETFTCEELIHTLRSMDLHKVKGFGYLSSYTRTSITDALHEHFGFRTDTEFISDKSMKKILKKTASH